MSDVEDWEQYAEEEQEVKQEVKQVNMIVDNNPQQGQNKYKESEVQSKEQDMNNVFDLFGGDKPVKKNIGQADLKKIGENFAAALQNVGPNYSTEFLKTLITKLEGKLQLNHFEELFKVVEEIYIKKRKQFEAEEAIKKKSQLQGAPKGVSFGKTKNIVEDEEDDFDNLDDDDDEFM
ncbi:unnamed protein product [Paramecium sonneborni]|uniref:Uncharacterized protein n=1 Tax=Paramecium sonneborni TaxID=65129 RepID=A0A8S1PFJ4_9CILI|nr:unnamed protein product [Paramecium sonneborni]